jgi:hypothetical protein
MKFNSTPGLDEDGSLPATFRCPSCDWGVTLLINPQETQLVRTLGVKVGSEAPGPPMPMEVMQTFLKGHHPQSAESGTSSSEGASRCPFSKLVQDA